MFISAEVIFNMNPSRVSIRVKKKPSHLRGRSDDEVLDDVQGGQSKERGRSTTRRVTVTTAEGSKAASLVDSEAESLAKIDKLSERLEDLVINKENKSDGKVDAKANLSTKGKVGQTAGAAGMELVGGDEGGKENGIKSEGLETVFDILEAHDKKINDFDTKLDIVIRSLNKLVQQRAREVTGTGSQIAAEAVSGGEGGSGVGDRRAVDEAQQQQEQQHRQQGVVVEGAGRTDQQQQRHERQQPTDGAGQVQQQQQQGAVDGVGRQVQREQQRPTNGAGQVQQQQQQGLVDGVGRQEQQRRPWRGNYSNNDALLMRQRELRGPYMIIYNLPEEQDLMPEMQHMKDLDDVNYMVSYIEDDDDHDFKLGEHIREVTRLGRLVQGKCRPIRVKFRGQLYRDAAVRLGYRIRYLHRDSHRNEILSKAVMCKDLCREDREKAKERYLLKKQQRTAVADDERNISTEPRNGTQSPPRDFSRDRQGAGLENSTDPRRVDQHNAP